MVASHSPQNSPSPTLREIIEWDCATWGQCIPFWEEVCSLIPGSTALAVGERGGGLSLWLASRGLRVHCTDLNGPKPQAREAHARYGLLDVIQYESANILSLPYPAASFDVVAFKSVLGALREYSAQRKAMSEVHRVLKPGGVLLMAENLVGTPLHRWTRKRFVRWAEYWRYIELGEIPELLGGLRLFDLRTAGFLGAFGRTETQRNLLAIADRLITVPAKWRYAVFLIARKE